MSLQSDLNTAICRLNSIQSRAEASAREFARDIRHAQRDVSEARSALSTDTTVHVAIDVDMEKFMPEFTKWIQNRVARGDFITARAVR